MDSLLLRKVGNGSRHRALARLVASRTVAATTALVALVALSPRAAMAQNDDSSDSSGIDADSKVKLDETPEPESKPESKSESKSESKLESKPESKPEPEPEAIKSDVPIAPELSCPAIPQGRPKFDFDTYSEEKNGYQPHPEIAAVLWHGNMQIDTSYASYTFESPTYNPEKFYDVRGRFVFGPTLTHEFGDHYFIRARGEGVAWVRDVVGQYQVNVDDVFAQVGYKGWWDVKVGRFFSWRVYHKGLGVDLYTLDDTGARSENDVDNVQGFGPHTYEVNDIYYRERPGRLAFHLYPADFLGIEALALYGRESQYNNLGARGAVIAHFPFLRLSAAAEYRNSAPAIEALGSPDPVTGARIDCTHCGVTNTYGAGGGAELTIKPIEISVNAAQEHINLYTVKDGSKDPKSSNKRTSIGGYAEFDLGSLVIARPLVFGFGWNRTEVLAETTDFSQHIQMQTYVAFPLGCFVQNGQPCFNDAVLKLVAARADLHILTAQGNGTFTPLNSAMTSIRLRYAMGF